MIISKQQDVLSSHDTLMKRHSTWLRFELLASVKVHLCASGWRLVILPIKTAKDNNLERNPPTLPFDWFIRARPTPPKYSLLSIIQT